MSGVPQFNKKGKTLKITMPLNYSVPPKKTLFSNIRNAVSRLFIFPFPEMLLFAFLFFSIILEISKRISWGWYLVFGIFVIGYFVKRIIRIIKKRKEEYGTKQL